MSVKFPLNQCFEANFKIPNQDEIEKLYDGNKVEKQKAAKVLLQFINDLNEDLLGKLVDHVTNYINEEYAVGTIDAPACVYMGPEYSFEHHLGSQDRIRIDFVRNHLVNERLEPIGDSPTAFSIRVNTKQGESGKLILDKDSPIYSMSINYSRLKDSLVLRYLSEQAIKQKDNNIYDNILNFILLILSPRSRFNLNF